VSVLDVNDKKEGILCYVDALNWSGGVSEQPTWFKMSLSVTEMKTPNIEANILIQQSGPCILW